MTPALPVCMACRKPLKYHAILDADGVLLILCAGCTGEEKP